MELGPAESSRRLVFEAVYNDTSILSLVVDRVNVCEWPQRRGGRLWAVA